MRLSGWSTPDVRQLYAYASLIIGAAATKSPRLKKSTYQVHTV
jgi:hypothetical protein